MKKRKMDMVKFWQFNRIVEKNRFQYKLERLSPMFGSMHLNLFSLLVYRIQIISVLAASAIGQWPSLFPKILETVELAVLSTTVRSNSPTAKFATL